MSHQFTAGGNSLHGVSAPTLALYMFVVPIGGQSACGSRWR